MIARENCVKSDELADLLAGRLPPHRYAQALEHVDTCPTCSCVAASMPIQSEFAWKDRSPVASPQGSYDHEPECQAIVGQLLLKPVAPAVDGSRTQLPVDTLGPYRLLKWLGSGGMGAVYLAEHQRLKRLSAIKLLPRDKLMQSDWLERFNREMTSIAALEHAHVVRAIDAGDQDGWHYLVMEYLVGADLSKVCRYAGQLPIGTACELIRQASLGLAAIHELGMTHRDIKPSNLFLTSQGNVKLLDLGLVLSGDSPLSADERLTTVGHLMGTLPYMAREQLLDASSVDWRADIYSLGATLYRMLTGRTPLGSAKNIAQTIQAITTTGCPTIESLQPDVPCELADLINRMLNHDRTKRPQSAKQVADELQNFGDPSSTQPLIQSALSQLDHRADSDASQALHSLLQSGPPLSSPASKPPSRRWPWIAAAFLPIAFLAGIVITVATDKGTLVIESEEPGVTVRVTQGNTQVDALKVESQAGQVRLYSGKYMIELVGAEGDGLALSDSQVSITRGQKEVVRISKQPTESRDVNANTALLKGSSYQGKSLAWWMDELKREKDVATIAQAMQALSLLVETDAERLAAAKQALLPARQLGGIILTGRPQDGVAHDMSGWYMTELLDGYGSFLPEPGLQAIIEELEAGRPKSALACLMLLNTYANRFHGAPFGAGRNVKLSEALSNMAFDQSGRNRLIRLSEALGRAAEIVKNEPTGSHNDEQIGWSMAVHGRLRCLIAINAEFKQDPQIAEWARMRSRFAEDAMNPKLTNGRFRPTGPPGQSPLDAFAAYVMCETLPVVSSPLVFRGLLEPVDSIIPKLEEKVTIALKSMAEQYPQEAEAAILSHLQDLHAAFIASNPGGFGMGGGISGGMGGNGMALEMVSANQGTYSPERRRIAKQVLMRSKSPDLSTALTNSEKTGRTYIFTKADIQEILQHHAPSNKTK